MKLIDFIARGRGAAARNVSDGRGRPGNRRVADSRRARPGRPGGVFSRLKPRHGLWILLIAAVVAAILSCGGRDAPDSRFRDKSAASGTPAGGGAKGASGAGSSHNPDKDALPLAQLAAKLGPLPKPAKAYRLVAILPYYGEEYWQVLARGMQSRAMELGVSIEMPAAASPADTKGELDLAMRELDRGCDALLLAPISAAALAPAVARAKAAGIPVLGLGQSEPIASVPLIGPSQYETGVRAAEYFLGQLPKGAKILLLAGDLAPLALRERTQGLTDRLAGSKISVADTVQGGSTPAATMAAVKDVLAKLPDLAGVYCTSDALALTAAQALAQAGKSQTVRLVGSGGESRAYDAIRQGELAATIDFFAYINGQAAVDGALRLLAGQILPQRITTPQNGVTAQNLNNPLPAGGVQPNSQ